jgi:hypothetical protein
VNPAVGEHLQIGLDAGKTPPSPSQRSTAPRDAGICVFLCCHDLATLLTQNRPSGHIPRPSLAVVCPSATPPPQQPSASADENPRVGDAPGTDKPPKDPRHALGRLGEQLAATHLERLGFMILARNARTRYGEIDLIAFDGHTLVFNKLR